MASRKTTGRRAASAFRKAGAGARDRSVQKAWKSASKNTGKQYQGKAKVNVKPKIAKATSLRKKK